MNPHPSSTFPHSASSQHTSSLKSFPSPVGERQRGHGGWLKHVFLVLPLCLVTLSLPWKTTISQPTRKPEHVDTQQAQFLCDASFLCASIVALQLLQFFSCSARFRQKHWFLHSCVWVSYYMPVPLSAYAVGIMLRFRPPYWLVAILFAAGHTDAMAAYSLHDDKKGVRRFAKQSLLLLQLVWFFVSLFQIVPPLSLWRHAVKVISILLSFFVFCIDHEIKSRTIPPSDLSSIVATYSIQVETRRKNTSNSSTGQDSFVIAVGCLGSDESALSGCTTLQDIEGHHINFSPHLRFPLWMKDIALSSGLFLQLLQRYDRPVHSYQNPLLEYRLRLAYFSGKSVRASRLLDSTKYQETGMDAFKLVEVQLSFMFDYFFSAHSSPSLTHPLIYLAYYLSKIALILSIYFVFSIDPVPDTPHHVTITTASSLGVLMLLELLQFHRFLMASKWSLVSYMSNLVKSQPCSLFAQKELPQLPSRPLKLGQYSLIEDFDSNSMKQRLLGLVGWSQKGTRANYIDLPENLIKATLYTLENHILRDTSPGTSNSAVTSLRRSSLLGKTLAWTCMQDTHTHTILIWHIATTYGEARSSDYPMVGHTLYYLSIATKLSRYCAYLVAFHPDLLPGDSLTTHTVLQELLQEAEMLFGHTGSINEKHRKLLKLALPEDSSQTTLQKGVRLGRQLNGSHRNQEEHWQMVAACWMRIYLYIAPSDNVAGHIEQLAKGGEFLTHLWACLSNLGIVNWEMNDDKPKWSTLQPAQSCLQNPIHKKCNSYS